MMDENNFCLIAIAAIAVVFYSRKAIINFRRASEKDRLERQARIDYLQSEYDAKCEYLVGLRKRQAEQFGNVIAIHVVGRHKEVLK